MSGKLALCDEMQSRSDGIPVEVHPWEPFLPKGAKVLILGSFPTMSKNRTMEFYYPNFNNDFWRIMGYIFYHDKYHFVLQESMKFDEEGIKALCTERGIALHDALHAIRRLKGNSSDNKENLCAVEKTDVAGLLSAIPDCRAVAATGVLAADPVAEILECKVPKMKEHLTASLSGRRILFYRMPSSSRAFPGSIESKATFYRRMFSELGIL